MNEKIFQSKKEIGIIILFAILTHFFYYSTALSGFVTDFTGLAQKIETHEFKDILNCFGFPAMEQIRNLFLWFFYKSFGVHSSGWYFVFTTFHIINAYLIYKVGLLLFSKYQIKKPALISFLAALLFLVSPYHTEPITWRVNFVFLYITFSLFAILRHLIFFEEKGVLKNLLWIHGLFIVALFTFELALITPIICFIYLIFIALTDQKFKQLWKKTKQVVLPQIVLIIVYFSLQKVILGKWIGHYGADVHLNFDPNIIFANLAKYTTKYSFFSRHLNHPTKEKIYIWLSEPLVLLLLFSLLILLFIWSLFSWRKLKKHSQLTWLFFAFYTAGLLPILNIFFYYLQNIENDRYGYLASAFFFLMLLISSTKLPNWLRSSLFVLYFGASIFYLQKNIRYWSEGNLIYRSLLEDFRWTEAENVYVLANPENYHGAGMFRRYRKQDSTLKDALEYLYGKKIKGQLHEIVQYNQVSPNDGFEIRKDSLGVIELKFKQYGNWWWDCGIGASNYETPLYLFKNKGLKCKITLKDIKPNDVIIYSNGTKWKELK